jgi:DNA-binding transcriptional LysR family regulator
LTIALAYYGNELERSEPRNLSRMSMQLQLYQVRYFLALARTLNFTRAAEQCNVTQPALTKAIQKLEQELGGTLIHRERHLTQLTELGKMILPTLEKIFAAAEAVRLQAQGYQKKTIAPLKIGLAPSLSAALIMELLSELTRIIPDLRVDLREADANGLVAMLLDGEINAALVGDAVELPERIDRWTLFEERYVLVLSRKHPMARQTVIPLEDLQEAVFLERVGCDIAGRFKQACFADHPGPKVVHRSAQESHLQQMASAGFGAILAPEHAPRLPSLAAVPIEGDPVRRKVELLAVAGRQYSPALDAFIKVARIRDWTGALDKLCRATAPAPNKDNVRKPDAQNLHKADAQGAGALI